MIGLCLVTYNRPAYASKSLKSIVRNLHHAIDDLVIVNDGSDPKYNGEYKRVYNVAPNATVLSLPENHGVAYAKNAGLTHLLNNPSNRWLFVIEDDILVRDSWTITRYVEACVESGMAHLSFAHHGPANMGPPVATDGPVTYWPHSIGAFTIFSRECLEVCGLLDEHMFNAFEHVEHEMRLIRAGFMPGAGAMRYPDATGSGSWLQEIPGSIDKSSIRPRPDWQQNIRNSLAYWQSQKADTFNDLFGEGQPLHDYAMSILGTL